MPSILPVVGPSYAVYMLCRTSSFPGSCKALKTFLPFWLLIGPPPQQPRQFPPAQRSSFETPYFRKRLCDAPLFRFFHSSWNSIIAHLFPSPTLRVIYCFQIAFPSPTPIIVSDGESFDCQPFARTRCRARSFRFRA